MQISDDAVKLMVFFEGMDVPWEWPGDASGITIGRGYDLGYEPFEEDWQGLLDATSFGRLKAVVGLRGREAADASHGLHGIIVGETQADRVFREKTLPKYMEQTDEVFKGSSGLPGDAFGGLVSLVYNRGMLVDTTPRRREMLALHKMFATAPAGQLPALDAIADQVDSMKRLWPDKGPNSLYARRVAEARLIRGAR